MLAARVPRALAEPASASAATTAIAIRISAHRPVRGAAASSPCGQRKCERDQGENAEPEAVPRDRADGFADACSAFRSANETTSAATSHMHDAEQAFERDFH